jgi:hypothetical protein
MLNIISKSVLSRRTSGPKKVVDNLIKGLNKIGYPYVINAGMSACTRLWIHDDITALQSLATLDKNIKVIVGPNLFVMPRNIYPTIDLSRVVYLAPSDWAGQMWKDFGFDRCPLDVWPTGIDTKAHIPHISSPMAKKSVLIYFKQRLPEELEMVHNILDRKKIPYRTIIYGHYRHKDYVKILESTRYIVWVGRQESQGIALEEALAMNIPILVWDVSRVGHWLASKREMAYFTEPENDYTNTTTAPYFDQTCGIKVRNVQEVEKAIDRMESSWQTYRPREFILRNLSLEKQARDFVNLYEKHFGLSYENGLKEKLLNDTKWRNDRWYYKAYTALKDGVKDIIR